MATGTAPLLRASLPFTRARPLRPALAAAVGRRRLGLLVCVLVAVTAFAVRLTMVLRGGGLGGLMAYDDGVYYSASGALWWGHLPYRDFVLVHPPGILLALAPFAGLGRLTHDAVGFELARLAWMLVGSLNAVLVVLATRRSGWLAAALAGLFYAFWTPAALTETTTRLEPLVSLGLLGAVAVLAGPRPPTRRGQLLVGRALGFALTVKGLGRRPGHRRRRPGRVGHLSALVGARPDRHVPDGRPGPAREGPDVGRHRGPARERARSPFARWSLLVAARPVGRGAHRGRCGRPARQRAHLGGPAGGHRAHDRGQCRDDHRRGHGLPGAGPSGTPCPPSGASPRTRRTSSSSPACCSATDTAVARCWST